jgi:hypothetical protein
MTGHDWVILLPVLLLAAPLVLELADLFAARKSAKAPLAAAEMELSGGD